MMQMQITVLKQIDELNHMSMVQLRKRWSDLLGTDPGIPVRFRRRNGRQMILTDGELAAATNARARRQPDTH